MEKYLTNRLQEAQQRILTILNSREFGYETGTAEYLGDIEFYCAETLYSITFSGIDIVVVRGKINEIKFDNGTHTFTTLYQLSFMNWIDDLFNEIADQETKAKEVVTENELIEQELN